MMTAPQAQKEMLIAYLSCLLLLHHAGRTTALLMGIQLLQGAFHRSQGAL